MPPTRDSLILLLSLLLAFILSVNQSHASWRCKKAESIPGKTTSGCITVDGIERYFKLHLPLQKNKINNNKNLPLIIGLHGGAGKPKRFENYSRLSKLSNKTGEFIAVYPEGIDKHWNDGRQKINSQVDDIKFLKRLVWHLKNDLTLAVDINKIYIVGMSNGGLMAMRIACEQPQWIAGAAIVGASMSTQIARNCTNQSSQQSAAINMIFIFGDDDSSFLPSGKQVNPVKTSQVRSTHIGIEKTLQLWANKNQCSGLIDVVNINNDKKDGTNIAINRYLDCQKMLVFYDIKNGGHRWPDKNAGNGVFLTRVLNLGLASHEINAAEEIWKLFRQE